MELTLLSINYFSFSSRSSIIEMTITGAADCPVSLEVEEISGSCKQLKLPEERVWLKGR